MRKIKISDIVYDINEEDVANLNFFNKEDLSKEEYEQALQDLIGKLPKEIEIEIIAEKEEEIEDMITEEITCRTGFLVNSYSYEYI